MNITIIGATSGVGLSCVNQALARGDEVIALSPRAEQLLQDNPMLIRINGSVTSSADVKIALKNAEAVLVCIGTQKKKGVTLFSDMARILIPAVKELCPDAPVLVVSGFGVGDSKSYLNLFMKIIISFFLKDQYNDKAVMEHLFAKSGLKWEMVRPGILSDAVLARNYQIFPNLYKGINIGKITRGDLAHFMLKEAREEKYIGHTPSITQ